MKRIIGAVAAVLAVVAVVIILLWQPWRTSPITAQVPAPQEPEQPQAAPLVSLAEMQSRLSDDDPSRHRVVRYPAVLQCRINPNKALQG